MAHGKFGRPRKGSHRGLTPGKVAGKRDKGWGPRRIAKTYGVTRQAVYQLMWRHGIA